MRIINILLILLLILVSFAIKPYSSYAREIVLYNFEKDPQGWEVPDWALGKKDHTAGEIGITEFQASNGKYALEMATDFKNDGTWQGAYVERIMDITDWSPFRYLSVDVYLPKDAPRGLRGRIILTVGEGWKWTEMNKSIPLAPGEWTILKVDLSADSMSWRSFINDAFRTDIKKMGVRVESNGRVVYKGPIYVDNIKLSD